MKPGGGGGGVFEGACTGCRFTPYSPPLLAEIDGGNPSTEARVGFTGPSGAVIYGNYAA